MKQTSERLSLKQLNYLVDVHPTNCDCGLCEPVSRATWQEVLVLAIETTLFVIVCATMILVLILDYARALIGG